MNTKPNFFLLAAILLIHSGLISQNYVKEYGPDDKDALLWSIESNSNFGDSPKFACMAWTYNGGMSGANRSLIGIDLSAIPPDATIIEAHLSFYFANLEPNPDLGHTGSNASFLQLITEEWDEHNVTWNNAPQTTDSYQQIIPESTNSRQDYENLDVTTLIQKIYQEPESYHGLMLRLIDESMYSCLLFASGDFPAEEKRPVLEITYAIGQTLKASFLYEVEVGAVDFINQSINAESWFWDFGDGNTSSEENPSHIYSESGTYKVCLKASNGEAMDEYCEDIEICFPPVAAFNHEMEGLEVSFQSISEETDTYFWDFGDGYFSSVSQPKHLYASEGSYTVSLTVFNSCSTDTLLKAIEVAEVIPQELPLLMVFPNPATDFISILPFRDGKLRIELLDLRGTIIHKEERQAVAGKREFLEVNLMSANYFIKVWLNDYLYTSKVIILNQ
ncbi:MAG: hypothetical protein CVT92_09110 [Bacteroidetes bacterium HGW-Bacteroidetes-1]|jgi:hypothetical protein|nr:MAG: hypothetical protein CVT92_09110 [Bacteroidetes bacterium HGW-Bacteroidetes-1]